MKKDLELLLDVMRVVRIANGDREAAEQEPGPRLRLHPTVVPAGPPLRTARDCRCFSRKSRRHQAKPFGITQGRDFRMAAPSVHPAPQPIDSLAGSHEDAESLAPQSGLNKRLPIAQMRPPVVDTDCANPVLRSIEYGLWTPDQRFAYSSCRRNQGPSSLRPFGARSSHWYMPQRPSSPRA